MIQSDLDSHLDISSRLWARPDHENLSSQPSRTVHVIDVIYEIMISKKNYQSSYYQNCYKIIKGEEEKNRENRGRESH